MADVQKALATQVKNIESRTGKTLSQLAEHISASGLAKHSEIVALLKHDFSLGYGDANTIALLAKQAGQAPVDPGADPLDALYVGPKSGLRAIHEALLVQLGTFGTFETAPKQKYISYRRKKQFAMIGPGTNTRVDLGLNIKALPAAERLEKLPPGQMCNYRIKLSDAAQVDAELVAWMQAAFDAAG